MSHEEEKFMTCPVTEKFMFQVRFLADLVRERERE